MGVKEERSKSNDVEFIVKPEKRVVVCKLYNCEDIAINRIFKQANNVIPTVTRDYCIDDIYVGVAYCSPEDTFDEKIGKEIALTKAKRKRGQAINNAINEYIKNANKDLKRLSEYGIHDVPGVKEY